MNCSHAKGGTTSSLYLVIVCFGNFLSLLSRYHHSCPSRVVWVSGMFFISFFTTHFYIVQLGTNHFTPPSSLCLSKCMTQGAQTTLGCVIWALGMFFYYTFIHFLFNFYDAFLNIGSSEFCFNLPLATAISTMACKGPNDASRVVWASGMFFFAHILS